MSSPRDWATLEALRNSPKGKLRYNQQWTPEEEAMISPSSCMLSPYAGWVLETVLPKKSPIISSECKEYIENSNGFSLSITESPVHQLNSSTVTDKDQEKSALGESCKNGESFLRLPSAKMLSVESKIHSFEEALKAKSRQELNTRLDNVNRYNRLLAEKAAEQFKRFEEMLELKKRQEKQKLEEQLEKDSKEALEQQEKLKEEHRHRAKLLTLKLREAEQQRQQELERSRQEEGRERMRRLCALQQEALQLIQKVEIDQKLQETLRVDLSSYSKRGNQICGNLSNVVRSSSEGQFPSQDDVVFGERSVLELNVLLRDMEKEVVAAQERCKAEEEAAKQKQIEAEHQQQQQGKAQASGPAQEKKQVKKEGLQRMSDRSIMQQYKELMNRCNHCFETISAMTTKDKDPQLKKTRAALQRAIFMPVAQINSDIGNLQVVFKKLNGLLTGAVVVENTSLSGAQNALTLEFVKYKLAERFVKQAEEEVATNHESAFPYAMVVSGIWEQHPSVGELFLANLYKKCPYAVPFYPPYKEGVSLTDYQRQLGYNMEGSKVEAQDNFLKRMSGMIRLYAAILQTRYPSGKAQTAHPHGLNYGWRWLAQILNLEPLSDITATILYDFLEVCGNALMRQYQGQFWKLILLLNDELMPRIQLVTADGQKGSFHRLKLFLEKILHEKTIPLPTKHQQFVS